MTEPISDEGTEQLMTAAVMYYEQSASQQEIALQLGVSRPTVSRLLQRARDLGIVQIEIVPPHVDPTTAEHLRERLGLRSVHIAAGRANESHPGPLLAEPFGEALDAAAPTSAGSGWGAGSATRERSRRAARRSSRGRGGSAPRRKAMVKMAAAAMRAMTANDSTRI